MIVPTDAGYIETKRLKRDGRKPLPPFDELAEWISSQYHVEVLNLFYDKIIPDNRPRLTVIFESKKDELKFRKSALGNFNRIDQKRIAEHFSRIVAAQNETRFSTDGLLVIFSSFEPVARMEANQSVSEADLKGLKKKLANPDLWTISRMFESVTFLFYTEEQIKKYEAAGLRDLYAREYSNLIQPHDEFGYFSQTGVSAFFDSKENFDKNYQGNWYYYYK
jgi:hypothetical protein